MTEKIIVNSRYHDVRAARLDADGKLLQLWFSHSLDDVEQNKIYVGRVQRVQAGLNAAFVDINAERAGFWPLQKTQLHGIKPGQMYLLQHKRAAKGEKGAKLTDKISLVGRMLVLKMGGDAVHLSRRISDANERQRLLEIGAAIKADNSTLIMRHASQGRSAEALQNECQVLQQQWQRLQKIDPAAQCPGPIDIAEDAKKSEQQRLATRIIGALLTVQTTHIVVDDKVLWQVLRTELTDRELMRAESVELYQRSSPIFDLYAVQGEIDAALQRKLWLKSGAFLVFDPCEALCAVDVNSGKSAQKGDFEQHALKINLQAVEAIARHLQLRNISGLIVVDFIDMKARSAQKQVVLALREALRQDPARCRLSTMSEFGLLQISRQRRGASLQEQLTESCSACQGLAWRRSRQNLAQDFLHSLAQAAQETDLSALRLRCQPELAEYLRRHEAEALQRLQQDYGAKIYIEAKATIAWLRCEIDAFAEHAD